MILLAFAALLFGAVLLSSSAQRSVLSTAVLFLVAGFVLGKGTAGLIVVRPDEPLVAQFTELALFSVLFTDGMRFPLRHLKEIWRLPGRALLYGMPLTLFGTALVAYFLVGLSWVEAALVGAVLSPTDPVFASALVGNDKVPGRLRHLLNVESGVNDGLALPFVIVLLALDWAVFRRRVWLDKLPFAILGTIAAVVAFVAQRGAPDTMVAASAWGFGARLLQACYGLCFYVWKTIWPTKLAALYPLPSSVSAMAWPFAIAAVIVVIAVAWIVVRGRTHRGLTAAAISYAAILAPVLGFAQSGPQLVADRYAYVAGIVISVVIACGLVALSRRISVRAIAAAGIVVVAIYGVAGWRQTIVWHDSASLWSHAIASGHESYLARFDLGQALRADGRLDEAVAEYRRALELRPSSGNAWYVYANALKAKGDVVGAEAAYQRAIAASDPASPEWMLAHVNLGNLYYTARRLDDAIAQYREAVRYLDTLPAVQVAPEPYLYLGMASADRGDVESAERALRVAARYPSTRARAVQELARLAAR